MNAEMAYREAVDHQRALLGEADRYRLVARPISSRLATTLRKLADRLEPSYDRRIPLLRALARGDISVEQAWRLLYD